MEKLTWIQIGFGVLLLLIWIVYWRFKMLVTRYREDKKKAYIRIEWDPKARRILLQALFVSGIANIIAAIVGAIIHDGLRVGLFLGIILITSIVLFTITYFAEIDNIKRMKEELDS